MEKLTKDISDIIINVVNVANEKVKGLNFLELLKNDIIEKILKFLSKQKFPLENEINFQKVIGENSRNLKISINYFIKPISITKKNLENDCLFVVFNEHSNFDIYNDEKNFKSLSLYKNTGISLPKDTVINTKYSKNALLVEIINKDIEEILTK
jgi:hypothetical protein